MQQLSRALGSVDTLVNHGIAEMRGGASAEHVLREVALMGALVGTGMSADRALRSIEAAESRLLGGVERAEAGYHTGAGGTAYGAMGQWGARMGMGMPTGQWGTMGAYPGQLGTMGAIPSQYGTMGAYPSQYGTMGAIPSQYGTMGVPGQLGTMGAFPGQFGTMGVPGMATTYGMASGQPAAMFIMPVGTSY